MLVKYIDGIPLFSTRVEAQKYFKEYGITTAHVHYYKKNSKLLNGYMPGSSHEDIIEQINYLGISNPEILGGVTAIDPTPESYCWKYTCFNFYGCPKGCYCSSMDSDGNGKCEDANSNHSVWKVDDFIITSGSNPTYEKALRPVLMEVASAKRIPFDSFEAAILKLIADVPGGPDTGKKVKCKNCINHDSPSGVCIMGACVNFWKWCWITINGVSVKVPCGLTITIQL